jgi:hypothetical protein
MGTARLSAMDGLLDWYWLGVLLGLGVADGAAGREARRAVLGTVSLALFAAAIVIALVALAWWGLVAFAGATLVSWAALRRLSHPARLVATLSSALLAFVPALGYVLAAVAPVAGARLGRRASSRYAGLRILAKD